jgi:hypothetical protein
MWNRKANRIEDLKARNDYLLNELESARAGGTEQPPVVRRSAEDAARIRELETRLRMATDAYRHQTGRLHRALRACARYRHDTRTGATS